MKRYALIVTLTFLSSFMKTFSTDKEKISFYDFSDTMNTAAQTLGSNKEELRFEELLTELKKDLGVSDINENFIADPEKSKTQKNINNHSVKDKNNQPIANAQNRNNKKSQIHSSPQYSSKPKKKEGKKGTIKEKAFTKKDKNNQPIANAQSCNNKKSQIYSSPQYSNKPKKKKGKKGTIKKKTFTKEDENLINRYIVQNQSSQEEDRVGTTNNENKPRKRSVNDIKQEYCKEQQEYCKEQIELWYEFYKKLEKMDNDKRLEKDKQFTHININNESLYEAFLILNLFADPLHVNQESMSIKENAKSFIRVITERDTTNKIIIETKEKHLLWREFLKKKKQEYLSLKEQEKEQEYLSLKEQETLHKILELKLTDKKSLLIDERVNKLLLLSKSTNN